MVGTIVTDPIRRTVGGQELIKLRAASNSRRRDDDGTWTAGNALYITVNCWGRLVTGVGAALGKGSPVIVVGTAEDEPDSRQRAGPQSVRSLRRLVVLDLSGYALVKAALSRVVQHGRDPQTPATTLQRNV